jgi:uncharacterized protein (DUF1501 family)
MTDSRRGELEADDAMRLLSVDDGPRGFSRRRFLHAALAVGSGAAAASMFPRWFEEAYGAAAPDAALAAADRILVIVTMGGGNDGLNTVVPIGEGAYYTSRGGVAIQPSTTLPMDGAGSYGLNPNLPVFQAHWNQGQLAVVRGIGYANPDRSHFSSMAIWMNGWGGSSSKGGGWIGRWLDEQAVDDPFRAIAIGPYVPQHMGGLERRASGMSERAPQFGFPAGPNEARLYGALRGYSSTATGLGAHGDRFAAVTRDYLDVAASTSTLYNGTIDDKGYPVARQLILAARLINAGLGTRVINVSYGDYDFHGSQLSMQPARFTELDTGLAAFFAALSPALADRVAVMTWSEFGRTLKANGSGGTDHGSSSSAYLLGAPIKGGMYGSEPSFTDLLDQDMLRHTVDFRQLYASVLEQWLGSDSTSVLGRTYEQLGVFTDPSSPGTPPATSTTAPATTTTQAPTTQATTTQATTTTTQPATTTTQQEATTTAAPATTAAATTTTVAEATTTAVATTTGAATTTTAPPEVTTSTTMAPPPTLPATTTTTAQPPTTPPKPAVVPSVATIPPLRLVDTRLRLGTATAAPLRSGTRLVVPIAGRSHVPARPAAALLNVTAVPTAGAGDLFAYPSGGARPTARALQFTAGQTVTNMAIVPVASNGAIVIEAAGGAAHVIVDLIGVVGSAPPTHGPVVRPASRLLDTRTNLGWKGPLAPGQPRLLQVAATRAVPAGATAALLNLTVVRPGGPSVLTVFRPGDPLPGTSTVNAPKDGVVANMVLAGLDAAGRTAIYNRGATCHVVADVVGYVAPGKSTFVSVAPWVAVDSKARVGLAGLQSAGRDLAITVAGRGGVPANAAAVVVRLAISDSNAASYAIAWTSGTARPSTSNLNYGVRATVANLAMVAPGRDGRMLLRLAAGTANVRVEVIGYIRA